MNRDEILRTDFTLVRKGYDPDAVDEHLRRIAVALGGAQPKGVTGSLAGIAGEKVMNIIDLVERTAAEIVEQADREAAAVVERAEKRMRTHLERAEQAIDGLADEAEAMRSSARELGQRADQEIRATIDASAVAELAEKRAA